MKRFSLNRATTSRTTTRATRHATSRTRPRKILSVAVAGLVAAMGLTLTACGTTTGEQRNADGAIIIQFWHAQSGDAGKLLQANVEKFNEEHKGEYQVNAIFQGSYSDNFSKLAANIQTGFVPTLMQASDVQTSYMKDSGLALPMEDALGEDAEAIKDDLLPAVSNYYVMDGKLWSMPLFVSLPASYINTDIAEEAGVDIDQLETFDDYFEAARQIHDATGIPGLVFASSDWFSEEFTANLNLNYCGPDNGVKAERATEMTFATDEYIDLWERIQEGYADGSIIDVGSGGGEGAALLTSGRVGIQFNSTGNVTAVQESGINFAMRALPRVSPETGSVPGGNSLWILKEGKTDEELAGAVEFAKFIASPEVQAQNLPESGYLPSTESAADLDETMGLAEQQLALLEIIRNTPATTVTAGCHMGALAQVRTQVGIAVQGIASGKDPRAEIENIEDSIRLTIERYDARAEATQRDQEGTE